MIMRKQNNKDSIVQSLKRSENMNEWFQGSKKTAVMALACLLLIAWCLAPVSAISVTGSKYMGSIAPGGTGTHTITISIPASQKATDIQLDVTGFGQAMDLSYITLDPASDISPNSGRAFIKLSNTTLHLQPGVPQVVIATITVPQNVGNGGRYAIISAHAVANKGDTFTTGVNIPVFITVTGTKPTETGSIQKVETGEVTMGQPIAITTTFKNTGNYHYYKTSNKVTVSDSKGSPIANVTSFPSAFAIIPGSTVQFIARPEFNTLNEGTYSVHSKVSLEDGTTLDEKTVPFEIKKAYIPPVTESTITLSPGSPATLTSPDARYSVKFPQGSVLGQVNVTLKPYARGTLSAAPQGAQIGATSFEIAGLSGLLSKDATIKVTYSADDLAAAGKDASYLKLAYYDTAQNAWVILPTQVNTQDTSLSATTNHLGVWAVMVSSSASSGSPAAAGATATKSPITVTAILASICIAAITAGYHAGKRK